MSVTHSHSTTRREYRIPLRSGCRKTHKQKTYRISYPHTSDPASTRKTKAPPRAGSHGAVALALAELNLKVKTQRSIAIAHRHHTHTVTQRHTTRNTNRERARDSDTGTEKRDAAKQVPFHPRMRISAATPAFFEPDLCVHPSPPVACILRPHLRQDLARS